MINYEYAVEPEAAAVSLDRLQNIFSRFGFEKGRLISDFPQKRWCLQVRLAMEQNGLKEGEEKRIKEELSEAKRQGKLIRFPRHFDDEKSWLKNAIESNRFEAFAKIITHESRQELPNMMFAGNMDDASFKTENHVKRDIDSLLSSSHMLLRFSSKIDIIDPYIKIHGSIEHMETREFLKKCMEVTNKYRINPPQFRVHYRDQPNMQDILYVKDKLKTIPNFIPDGMAMELYCWRKREGSDLPFHDRYLIGNKGGISLGAGFEPRRGETTTLLRHENDDIKRIRQCFAFDGSGHEWIEPGLRIYPKGRCVEFRRGDIEYSG